VPTVLGGSSGGTTFYTLDVDSNENIAIGGTSSDSSVVSATGTPNAFALHTSSVGGSFTWSVQFDSSYDQVNAIAFNDDSSRVVAVLDASSTLMCAILSAVDGSLVNSY
jgi:hypothetical protein